MAQRRMFSKEITNSSEFLMMSQSAQNLYFHIGMNADDDGFCEVFTIMRMTESKPDDLSILHAKGFVYVYDNKICIVRDWHKNNQIRKDRYTQSKYLDDKNLKEIYFTIMDEKVKRIEIYQENLKSRQPAGNQMSPILVPQVRLGKVRLKNNVCADNITTYSPDFEQFWSQYPKKVAKKKCVSLWSKMKPIDRLKSIEVLPRHISSEKWWEEGGKFIPHPATWLGQGRWDDEVEQKAEFISRELV